MAIGSSSGTPRAVVDNEASVEAILGIPWVGVETVHSSPAPRRWRKKLRRHPEDRVRNRSSNAPAAATPDRATPQLHPKPIRTTARIATMTAPAATARRASGTSGLAPGPIPLAKAES